VRGDTATDGIAGRSRSPEDKQYALLKEYHSQGLAQSRTSFWFSLIFAALGFAVILIGLISLQADKGFSKQSGSFISLMAGTIIDAVSALFFVQSIKARQLMSDFFDKLRTDRKLEEALRLVDQIDDPVLKARMKSVLTMSFAGVAGSEAMTASLLGLPVVPQSSTLSQIPPARDETFRSNAKGRKQLSPKPVPIVPAAPASRSLGKSEGSFPEEAPAPESRQG
jgi:hypothetical protein